ncbi:GH1 family beta-glucosidase [Thermomicrobiaceae bacterium CFH 74404]|uniref:Beta-glucosidase n=1 Tax=Thermalbibacter longus TaxID=2951981 RepID=A0AA41WBJ9_9BACT|nr:GH1 family beta-glucosidase [Thermalbibacter longus]MCM8748747.1 GH1 family beta-glucosidase [Thermalbibacter longus]
MVERRFPDGFLWGTATAAYQIEGAVDEDGRGPSIWDTFSHTPGKTFEGHTGDVACDHYHRWPEDVHLMQQLGAPAYRFSIAWPRILPQGTGQVNQRGLDFYDRLVDALLQAEITPFVTLYHWDLPQALQDRGGWAARETAEAFAAYADVVARRLGDRVKHWITHNEPWVVAFVGHFLGVHAPGIQDARIAIQVSHHLLLSHGHAVPAIRAASPDAQVGITLNLSPVRPATEAEEDRLAAQRYDGFLNRWFLDPLFGRGYPQDMLATYGELAPTAQTGDLDAIAVPIDFLGVNYYTPAFVRYDASVLNPLKAILVPPEELQAAGYELTEMGWAIVPDGLYELLIRLQRDFAPSTIYITENGAAFADQLEDGAVRDPKRIAFLHDHFAAAHRALQDGVPLRGYFVWSLMDNFEWAHGYSKRFGLIYIDYETLERIPKESYAWYSEVIRANGLVQLGQ